MLRGVSNLSKKESMPAPFTQADSHVTNDAEEALGALYCVPFTGRTYRSAAAQHRPGHHNGLESPPVPLTGSDLAVQGRGWWCREWKIARSGDG